LGAYSLTADVGAITVADPTTTKLEFGRVAVASLGTLTLGGQSATLRYSRKLLVTSGALTLAGPPVTLRYAHALPAGSGGLVVSGKDATLIYGGSKIMTAARGVIELTGCEIQLSIARRPPEVPPEPPGPGTLSFGWRVDIGRW
jgi:hypothetical protein